MVKVVVTGMDIIGRAGMVMGKSPFLASVIGKTRLNGQIHRTCSRFARLIENFRRGRNGGLPVYRIQSIWRTC
jgi:hypothetical protein